MAREANLEVPRDPSPPALAPKVQLQVDQMLASLVDYGVALVARLRQTRDQIRSAERANRKILEVLFGSRFLLIKYTLLFDYPVSCSFLLACEYLYLSTFTVNSCCADEGRPVA